ncbi:MAG: response regulator transcription factor [Clostridia bacterium]|nr:response regulator transcription factor [Clostridia bacterium]MBR1675774.1 response regulator transcription factor [Clostridia bacterium]
MKLLLAEDERELSNALVRLLNFNKFDVDAAYDGEQALKLFEENSYDGIILDVMMPKKDGIAVVEEIRKRGSNVPVLMLTAKSEIDDRVSGLDAGADDYLTKPFAVKELLARIRALTRRQGTITESYSFSNVTLLPQTSEMKAVGTVRLTRKEYALMELLIRNKNVLLSTERIMESVWEFESEADLSVVWVFISSLRKKLDGIGANATIKAVRGVGYRLDDKKA